MVIVSLAILSYSVKRPAGVGFFRKLVMETAAPVAHMISASFRGIDEVWKRYIFLIGIEDENRRLKQENASLSQELVYYREGFYEGIRLQKLLILKEKIHYPTIVARVIGRDQTSIVKTILIDKGISHGLKVDLPVIAERGVVGRIIETSSHVSKILLLIDENSNIDAIVQESRIQGILQGAASRGCSLKYVSKTETVSPGNIVITSGLSGIFPKGLLIGEVSNADKTDSGLFQKIDIVPYVDFSRLEEVIIIQSNTAEKK